MTVLYLLHAFLVTSLIHLSQPQFMDRGVGKLQEVFAWRQLTFNVDGIIFDQDRAEGVQHVLYNQIYNGNRQEISKRRQTPQRPSWNQRRNDQNSAQNGSFFIQYNNVPIGAERVGNRLFVTVPGRRYGILSTLNYIDLTSDSNSRSPPLRPYPNLRVARSLVSVYRTKADQCGRLWMVDTGLLEIPNVPQQVQPPSIVVFDLYTNRHILKYEFKSSDLPSANTPAGLASITVDVQNDCSDTYAYIPDLTTYGIIVYSLKDNDSWRLSHNFLHFSPAASTFNIAGQRFQWNDGIFSIALGQRYGNCRVAYFHPLTSTQEFSVSTCVLKNRNSSVDSSYWEQFALLGDRGLEAQCTKHDFHEGSRVIFFADVGRDSISCWHTGKMLTPSNVVVLERDDDRLSYPSDLHVTGDEVWVMVNRLPRFSYSTLDTYEYNFFVYRANVQNLIAGTVCDGFSMG